MRKTIIPLLLLACCACKLHPKPTRIAFGNQHFVDKPRDEMYPVQVDSSLKAQFPWAESTVESYFKRTSDPAIRQYYTDTTMYPSFTHLQTIEGTRFLVAEIIHDYEDPEKGGFADMIGHLFIDTESRAIYQYEPYTNSIMLWQPK